MSEQLDVTFEDSGDHYKIRMNGLLQLLILKEEFLSIYSYINGVKHKRYYIDIIYKSTVLTTQYFTKERWEKVLKVLDENII